MKPSDEVLIQSRRAQRRRLAVRFTLLAAFVFVCLRAFGPTFLRSSCSTHLDTFSRSWRTDVTSQAPLASSNTKSKRVPLEAHIMSKCPDARDCLRDLVVPAIEKIKDKVDFRLSFIGWTDPHNDGVTCMHGQTECLGNLLELCAAKLYPQPKTYLGFTLCLSLSYPDIPARELVESCALESGIDKAKLEACTADDNGHLAWGLLKKSFQRSEDANVTASCTVRLAEEVRCIRDAGEWKDCEGGSGVKDLVGDVERLYGERNGGGKKEDV
ncbi:uncharacterized protein MYCGRDRAFT_47511 [Zymoseptoria tritici IPO323]|uniref:Gamma interferon inducible lysosomal thiol reductase n=1 Tax=Zymoseptoria tritici (strain CBS 115943 / IPO323) TaxID=336722 RepID=F9XJV1_ZYMTI|nr:uncharacterized protein MYCGRDRAFT_47511 [Zymoseptoria tritici IPO323]EGP84253.1 hypothetical protein MYCGRDRAFT_47511 [Zymoseptoria tritici IPO323]